MLFTEFIPGSCGGEIHINDEHSGQFRGFEIVSPGFSGMTQTLDYTPGDGYDNNMHCVWKIIADQNPQVGQWIRLALKTLNFYSVEHHMFEYWTFMSLINIKI